MAGWTYWMVDAVTGDRLAEIQPKSWSGQPVLNDTGQGDVTLSLADFTATERLEFVRDVWRPTAVVVVQCWLADNGVETPVTAGTIGGGTVSGVGGIDIQNPHFDLWDTLQYRKLIGVADNPARSRYLETGFSYLGMIARALEVAQNNTEATSALPVLPPTGTMTGPRKVDWAGYNDLDAAGVIKEIVDSDLGPDVWFRPTWDASSRFRWKTEAYPRLNSGHVIDLNLTGENVAQNLKVTQDIGNLATRRFGIGEGSGPTMLMRSAAVAGSSYPTREVSHQWKDVKTYDGLIELLQGQRAANSEPFLEVTVSIRADGDPDVNGIPQGPAVTDLLLGCTVRLQVEDHPLLAGTDWKEFRLTGFDTTNGLDVALHLASGI